MKKLNTEIVIGCTKVLSSLVRSHVGFIQEGKTPSLHEAANDMIHDENENTIQDAGKVYRDEMQKQIRSDTPSKETIGELHEQCEKKAIEYLRCNIIYDDIELFLDTAKDAFANILSRLRNTIDKELENTCLRKLKSLHTTRIGQKIEKHAYEKETGYNEYIADIQWVIKLYNDTTELGQTMQHVLQTFLEGTSEEEQEVYQMVIKARKEHDKRFEEEQFTPIERTKPERLPVFDEIKPKETDVISVELIKLISDDQELLKKDISDTFSSFLKLKIDDYERQLEEDAESAAVTKEENERFQKMFCVSPKEQTPKALPKDEKCNIL